MMTRRMDENYGYRNLSWLKCHLSHYQYVISLCVLFRAYHLLEVSLIRIWTRGLVARLVSLLIIERLINGNARLNGCCTPGHLKG